MLTIADKILRAAKAKYLQLMVFDYEFGDCSVEELKSSFSSVIDMKAKEFYSFIELLSVTPEDRCLCSKENDACEEDNEYKPGDWYQNEYVGGFILEDGSLDVCEEYGPPADFGLYDIDVANGLGYYDKDGYFVRYMNND